MAVLATEAWTGSDGAAWSSTRWTATTTDASYPVRIVGGAGELRAYNGSNARAFLKSMPVTDDVDVTLDAWWSGSFGGGRGWRLSVRCDDTTSSTPPTGGYRLQMLSDTDLEVARVDGTTGTTTTVLTPTGGVPGWAAPTAAPGVRLRFQVAGDVLRVKFWTPGATEPDAWAWEYDDSAGATAASRQPGKLHLMHSYSGTVSVMAAVHDNLTVSTVTDPKIAVRGVVGTDTGSTTSTSLQPTSGVYPTGTAVGDTALVFVATYTPGVVLTPTDQPWTLVQSVEPSTDNRLGLYVYACTITSPGAVPRVRTSTAAWTVATWVVFTGAAAVPEATAVSPTAPVSTLSTSLNSPSVPVANADDLIVYGWAVSKTTANAPSITVPVTQTRILDNLGGNTSTSGPNVRLSVATRPVAVPATVADAPATFSDTAYRGAAAIVLRPAVVSGAGTLTLTGTAGQLQLSGAGPGSGLLALRAAPGRLELWQSQDKTTLGPPDAPHLAVEVAADIGGDTFVLDVDELDGDKLLGWPAGDERVWSNVVCDVQSVELRRGVTRVAGALTRAEAGALTVVLEDTLRRFDPYADTRDVIDTGLGIRLRAWGFTDTWEDDGTGDLILVRRRWSEVLGTARIDALAVSYPQDGPPLVTVSASDVIGALVAYEQEAEPEPGLGRGERLLARVRRILEQSRAGELAEDVDYAYATTLAPTQLEGDAWRHVSAAADAELGRVWSDRHDRLVVRGRGTDLVGELHGTLSDVHGELTAGDVHCCYTDPAVVLDTQQLTNRARPTRRVWEQPATAGERVTSAVGRADDLQSQARYKVHGTSPVLEVERDSQLGPWARTVVESDGRPELRVDAVTPRPDTALDAWPAVCRTDIGDRWAFLLHPAQGEPVERTLGVLGVAHTITPGEWTTTWTTTDAPAADVYSPDGFFLLNLSDVDGDDVLAPYTGAEATWGGWDLDGGGVVVPEWTGAPVDGGAPLRVTNDPPLDGGTA